MDLGLILVTLKFVGIGLSTAFGVALLTEYRDESRRITLWGRVAIVGSIDVSQSSTLFLKERPKDSLGRF